MLDSHEKALDVLQQCDNDRQNKSVKIDFSMKGVTVAIYNLKRYYTEIKIFILNLFLDVLKGARDDVF